MMIRADSPPRTSQPKGTEISHGERQGFAFRCDTRSFGPLIKCFSPRQLGQAYSRLEILGR